jgi:hypothetical protein
MKNPIEILIEKAFKSLNMAANESCKISKNTTTELINTEFNFGKFHAYMDMLKDLDIETYIELYRDNKATCNMILSNIKKGTKSANRMTLGQYLKESEVDLIANDKEFCETEHDIIAEYFKIYEATEEDKQLAESKGYDISYFENE